MFSSCVNVCGGRVVRFNQPTDQQTKQTNKPSQTNTIQWNAMKLKHPNSQPNQLTESNQIRSNQIESHYQTKIIESESIKTGGIPMQPSPTNQPTNQQLASLTQPNPTQSSVLNLINAIGQGIYQSIKLIK